MRIRGLLLFVSLLVTLGGLAPVVSAGALDRTVLPIKRPEHAPITELDARNAQKPSMFEVKLQFDYDGGGTGKGGLAILYVDGKKVSEGRVEKTQPAVYSADETADVGKDESTQVADKVFKDVEDSDFTGTVVEVTIAVPERK